MEKGLQRNQSTNGQNQSLQISSTIKKIGKELIEVNQLSPFPLTAEQVVDWAKSIEELIPDIDPTDLRFIINEYKTDELEYDQRKGIQNIFSALKYHFNDKYFKKEDIADEIKRIRGF